MRLSLSARIAESSDRKDRAAVPIEALAPLAAAAGFEAVSVRASVVSVDSPPERIAQVRRALDGAGLVASMVTGNVALAANSADAPDALGSIEPHLDLAEALGSRLVRVMIHGGADVPAVRRAADTAAERGLSLVQQTHWGTACETVDEAIDLVHLIDRPNFAITFEPANVMACGGDYGPDAVRRLAPFMANFYFQNVRLDPAGTHVFHTRARGPVPLDYVALDDPAGIAAAPLVDALAEAGYDGWITAHQPLRAGQTVEQAVDEAARLFAPFARNAAGPV